MVRITTWTSSIAGAALVLTSATWAHAATEAEITEALTAVFTATDTGTTVTLGSPTASGNTLVYKGVEFRQTDGGAVNVSTVDTMTVTGGDLNAAGALTADQLMLEGLTSTSADGTTVTVGEITVEDLDVKEKPVAGTPPVATYASIAAGDMTVAQNGKTSATVESLLFEAENYVGNVPRSVNLSVDAITVDPAGFDDGGAAAAQLQAFGYEKLVLSLVGKGALDEASGDLSVEEFSISGVDAGTLSLTATLGGFTPEVIAQMSQPEPPPTVLDAITIQDAELVFEDASLAGRILGFQATQMGTTAEALADQLSAALPLMLTPLQNPAFQNTVATAAGAFLKDPQNISVTAAPEAPVSLATVIGLAQSAPQTLPQTLNVSVTANQDLPE